MRQWLKDPKLMTAVHGWLAITWVILSLITTVLAWMYPDSPLLLTWVIFMSGYANAAGHWSARQGAESEANSDSS